MSTTAAWRRAMWEAIGQCLAAHAVMLRDVPILDDASVAALLTAIDGVQRGEPPAIDGSLSLVAAFDERFDNQTATGAVGAGRIARARHDIATTAQRLVLRDLMLDLLEAQQATRIALLDLAESHVFTLMPAWSGSALLQPTNLAHFLSGAIAPLARSASHLQAAYAEVDRTALGAGALAGPGLPADREETAELLGSEGPMLSTFDALAAVDHFVLAGEASALAVAPVRRLLGEFLLWIRTEPRAIRLADELLAPSDAHLPHFRPPAAIERAIADAGSIEQQARALGQAASELPFGPIGEMGDRIAMQVGQSLSEARHVSEVFAAMISGPIEFNRAWLARNSGRGLITAGDLGDFFMAEEQIDPASARDIAALVTSRAEQEALEASAITPQMIDAAALLVVGRELGIEIERLGAYLAPRRFIEKRAVIGGPAAPAVRDYLALERERLAEDERWLAAKRRRIAMARENLEIRSHEILAAASS